MSNKVVEGHALHKTWISPILLVIQTPAPVQVLQTSANLRSQQWNNNGGSKTIGQGSSHNLLYKLGLSQEPDHFIGVLFGVFGDVLYMLTIVEGTQRDVKALLAPFVG